MKHDNSLKEKFVDIFKDNIGIILKISRAYTDNKQDREDLVNDIAIELWKSFRTFKGKSKISTWIYRVALNTSMNYRRKKKNDFIFFSDIKKTGTIEWLDEPQDNPELDLFYKCIEELDRINKALIILYLEGNSYDEISEITGISKTNVGTKISRIKKQIKQIAIKKE